MYFQIYQISDRNAYREKLDCHLVSCTGCENPLSLAANTYLYFFGINYYIILMDHSFATFFSKSWK